MKNLIILVCFISLIVISGVASHLENRDTITDLPDSQSTTIINTDVDYIETSTHKTETIMDKSESKENSSSSSEEDPFVVPFPALKADDQTTPQTSIITDPGQVDSEPESVHSPSNPLPNHESSESDESSSSSSSSSEEYSAADEAKRDGNIVFKKKNRFYEKYEGKHFGKLRKGKN